MIDSPSASTDQSLQAESPDGGKRRSDMNIHITDKEHGCSKRHQYGTVILDALDTSDNNTVPWTRVRSVEGPAGGYSRVNHTVMFTGYSLRTYVH